MLEVREATEPVLQIDAPINGEVVASHVTLTGYAFDPRAVTELGVDGIHVWVYPNWGSGQRPYFVNLAFHGYDAPDVGSSFGLNFSLRRDRMFFGGPAGTQEIAVFAHSSITGVCL